MTERLTHSILAGSGHNVGFALVLDNPHGTHETEAFAKIDARRRRGEYFLPIMTVEADPATGLFSSSLQMWRLN